MNEREKKILCQIILRTTQFDQIESEKYRRHMKLKYFKRSFCQSKNRWCFTICNGNELREKNVLSEILKLISHIRIRKSAFQ